MPLKFLRISIGVLAATCVMLCWFLLQKGTFDNSKIIRHEGNYLKDVPIRSATNPLNLSAPMTMESTPIFFKGRLISVASIRSASIVDGNTKIRIDDFSKNEIKHIADFSVPDFGLISAVVRNDLVYVFGVTKWDKSNEIRVISSADLINWSEPRLVFRATKDQIIFNTSAAVAPDGKVIVAYEVKEPNIEGTQPGAKGFSPRFIKSDDLQSWETVGKLFLNEESVIHGGVKYSACPTLKYLDGKFYMTYLAFRNKQFITLLARSSDLNTWEYADIPVFVPVDGEGINNSDVDFVEANGNIYFLYHTGNQQSWGNLKLAEYRGSLKDFFQEFKFHSETYIRFKHSLAQLIK